MNSLKYTVKIVIFHHATYVQLKERNILLVCGNLPYWLT